MLTLVLVPCECVLLCCCPLCPVVLLYKPSVQFIHMDYTTGFRVRVDPLTRYRDTRGIPKDTVRYRQATGEIQAGYPPQKRPGKGNISLYRNRKDSPTVHIQRGHTHTRTNYLYL